MGEFWRTNLGTLFKVMQTDLENIVQGVYPMPYDLTLAYSKQWNPQEVLNMASSYMKGRETSE